MSIAYLIACYMVAVGCNMTLEGSYIFDYNELNDDFGVNIEEGNTLWREVLDNLYSFVGIESVWTKADCGEDCFDINFYTNYCGTNVKEDE